MKIVDRYLAKTVISVTAIVLFVILIIVAFISIIGETRLLGQGYTLLSAFKYIGLNLPYLSYLLFPIATLLGTLLGLALLERHSELIILRSTGLSRYQIVRSLFRSLGMMVIVAVVIGEWLAPKLRFYAENYKTALRTDGQALMNQHGAWLKEGNRNFLYIHFTLDSKHLNEVTRYQLDEQNHLISVDYAARANYENKHWVMYDVASSKITPQGVTVQKTPQTIWPISFDPRLLRISIATPDNMSLKQLYDFSNYLQRNQLNDTIYRLAFWQRMLQPLSVFVLVLLAVPFSFALSRSSTLGLKMFLGLTIGFSFYAFNQLFGPFVMIYQWPPLIAALLPLLIFGILGCFLLWRMKV